MGTTRTRITLVNRGDLLQGNGGFVIADTLSATEGSRDGRVEPQPFWYDTDGGRHFADADGLITVGVPGFRTRDYGRVTGGKGHILLNAVPGERVRGLCPASRNAALDVWSSGTALTAVDCGPCRKMAELINTEPGKRVRYDDGRPRPAGL